MPTELPDDVPPLRTYYFYLTGDCNLACRHCWITPKFVGNGKNSSESYLPFDLFEQAIHEGEELGLTHLKFTGGEPFLHPDIQRMLNFAFERELGVTIETNGTLVTPSLARYLKEKTTVSFISVSLDGATASTHDYMRAVPGSFERARQGIRNLLEAGYHPQVIMSLFEGNLDEIELLAEWTAEVGCSSLKLNIIQNTGRGAHFNDKIEEINQLIELGLWIENTLQEHLKIPILYSWPPAFQRIRRLTRGAGCNSCDIFNILGILHTGHMALCGIGEQDENLIYGMLGNDLVAEVWKEHPTILQIRDNVPGQLKGICGNCLFRDMCLGFCVALNYHRTKDLLTPFWFCELGEQAGKFPMQRIRSFDF